jgi:two-component system CheB/CheR fusion protein
MRVRPYRTNENRIEGAIILFVEVDEMIRAVEELTTVMHQPVVILSPDLKVIHANPAFLEFFGLTPQKTINASLFALADGGWNIPALVSLLDRARRDGARNVDLILEQEFPGIGRRKLLFRACRLHQQQGGIALAIREVDGGS